jgi:hypothetical protein
VALTAIPVTTGLPAVAITAGSTVTLTAVAVTVGIPTVAASAGSTVTLTAVAVTVGLPAVAASSFAGSIAILSAVAATVGVPAVAVSTGSAIQLAAVAVTIGVPAVTASGVRIRFTYDSAVFYRNSTTRFVLVVGLNRMAAVGYNKSEGWYRCSGKFALPMPDDGTAMDTVKATWVANKAATTEDLTVLVNADLTAAGYRRSNNSLIV